MNEAIHSLRTKIKGNESEARECRKKIHQLRGMERWQAWQDKRKLGAQTRVYLLALTYLRGRAYRSAEPRTRNLPSLYALARELHQATAREFPREVLEAWVKADAASCVEPMQAVSA